jgi:hypothetical protein
MIETLYKTEMPEKGRSECYMLVLTARPASEGKTYVFMEEHGHWDGDLDRFIHEVESINTEGALTRDEGLALFNAAKKNLAELGFIHAFVQDYGRKRPQVYQLSDLVGA